MKIIDIEYGKLLFDGHDGVVSKYLNGCKFHDEFLKQYYDKYITADSIVLEAGGHVGTHSIYLAKKCKQLLVFEPQKYCFFNLLGNLFLNHCFNVTPYNLALFSKECFLWCDLDNDYENMSGKAGISFHESHSEYKIQAITLDSLNLDRLDFIKIDAENNDFEVILGALETIKRHKPIIVFEEGYSEKKDRYYKLFSEINYSVTSIEDTNTNFICIPNNYD